MRVGYIPSKIPTIIRLYNELGVRIMMLGHEWLAVPSAKLSRSNIDTLFFWSLRSSVQAWINAGGQPIFTHVGYIRRAKTWTEDSEEDWNRRAWRLDPGQLWKGCTDQMWTKLTPLDEGERCNFYHFEDQYRMETCIRYEEPEDRILFTGMTPPHRNVQPRHRLLVGQDLDLIMRTTRCMKKLGKQRLDLRFHPIKGVQQRPLFSQLNRCKYVVTSRTSTPHDAFFAGKDAIVWDQGPCSGYHRDNPDGDGVVYDCQGSEAKLLEYMARCEERVENGDAKKDWRKEAFLSYLVDREWSQDDLGDDVELQNLLQGCPKKVGVRVEMHQDWHALRDRGVRAASG